MKCAIFDLDGTLLNTIVDLANSVNYALSYHSMPTHSVEKVKMMVGNGVQKLIDRAVPTDSSEDKREGVMQVFREYYLIHGEDNTLPYDGIIEMLQQLKEKDIAIAVVSNKFDKATKLLCNKYFGNLIDIAVGENEAEGIKKKPSPDMVLKVMSDLNVEREDCIYIGDSDVDIQTASNAKIPCISVLWGFRSKEFLLEHKATSFANTASDLIPIICKV